VIWNAHMEPDHARVLFAELRSIVPQHLIALVNQ
jgi:hypothetical protein